MEIAATNITCAKHSQTLNSYFAECSEYRGHHDVWLCPCCEFPPLNMCDIHVAPRISGISDWLDHFSPIFQSDEFWHLHGPHHLSTRVESWAKGSSDGIGQLGRSLVENHALRTQIRDFRDRRRIGSRREDPQAKPETCQVMILSKCFIYVYTI